MHFIGRIFEITCLVLAAAAALPGCSSVAVWQPSSSDSSWMGAPARAPIIERRIPASQGEKPASRSQEAGKDAAQALPLEPQPEGPVSFEAELKASESGLEDMRPGFIISGEAPAGRSSATITLEARMAADGALVKKLVLHAPLPLLEKIGIETPSGVQTLAAWLSSGKRGAALKAAPAGDHGTAQLQIRVKQMMFPDGKPGIAVDIGNQKAPSARDFIMALRESDASFIEVEEGAEESGRVSLRHWLTERAGASFRVPEQSAAPLIEAAREDWAAFGSVRDVSRNGGMTESRAKALVAGGLKLSLTSSGLGGEGELASGGRKAAARRCSPSGDNALGLPLCRRDAAGLLQVLKAAGQEADPVFIELQRGAVELDGIGGLLMKAGGRLVTMDGGRLFFWSRTASTPHEGVRVYEAARIDTTR